MRAKGWGGKHDPKAPISDTDRGALSGAPMRAGVVEMAAIGVTYFVLAKAGLTLASINPSATPIWPPTGLALAAIILWGYRVWPAIFLAALAANVTTAGTVTTSTAIALGNTLECLVGGYLVHRWSGGPATFDTPGGATRFALISIGAATPISATIGAGSLHLAGFAGAAGFASIWMTWWLGDLAGALVIAPVIVLWARSEPRSLTRGHLLRTGAALAGTCMVGIIAFSPLIEQSPRRDPLGFLAVVPLLWAALRCGPRDTVTVALTLSAFAVWGTMMHGGPFARPTMNDSFLLLLMFMISISVPSLVLSADVEARRRAERSLSLLAIEVDHRCKNLLAVVQGILRLTRAPTAQAFTTAVIGRIDALARAHSLISQSRWEAVDLGSLVREELAPYRTDDAARARIHGPSIALAPMAAQAFAMALHELATNSAKYGALSVPLGRISVEWHVTFERKIELRWAETGGPTVVQPDRSGLGTRVIERAVRDQLDGDVRFDWREEGLVCTIAIPTDSLTRVQRVTPARI